MVTSAQDVTTVLQRLRVVDDGDEAVELLRQNLVLLTPLVDAPLATLAAQADEQSDDDLKSWVEATRQLLEWGRTVGPTAFLADLAAYVPQKRKRARMHGFRQRMKAGWLTFKRRRADATPPTEYFELFLATGEPAFLDAAVQLLETMVSALPPGDSALPAFMHDLSAVLNARAMSRSNAGDADRAVAAAEQAVAESPVGSPALSARLGNYANVLVTRYGFKRDPSDLDRAVDAGARAVDLPGRDDADRFKCRVAYASALLARYDVAPALNDLRISITAARGALQASQPATAERTAAQELLARALKREARDGDALSRG